jgi:hypothetical protein
MGRDLDEVRAMPNDRYVEWRAYFVYAKAQRELAQAEAARG